ncbi:MAG: hypothetical protein R3B89_15630 [Polyangiaceae bacterium]
MQPSQDTRRSRPPRGLWIRPVCLTLIAALLPLDWKRTEVSGCNGQPGEAHLHSGWDLVSEGAWLLAVLSVLSLFLLWRSVRIDPDWRLFPATLGLLTNAVIGFAVFFALTFELFSRSRILWPGWAAVSSAGALALEGLIRFLAEVVALVRRRRAASARPPPT